VATPDPFASAAAASEAARSAVEDAVDQGLLKRRDARDLLDRLDRYDRALADGDASMAREEARGFRDAVARHLGGGEDDGDVAAALRSATDDLVAAAEALPD
jgi:hypothetical protein